MTVSTQQQRIAELAKPRPEMSCTSLNHYLDVDWLREAYRRLRKASAPGYDGQTVAAYGKDLETNLQSLLDRAKSGTYFAPPVRRVYLPKGTGKATRPIGIPTTEGKPLQPRSATDDYDVPPEDWISIAVPAIVSSEVFAAVQEQLEENRRHARQSSRGALYLLQGLLQCQHGGYAFYGKRLSPASRKGNPRAYAYYRCLGTDAYRFGGERICPNTQVRTDRLDLAVWQEVCALLAYPVASALRSVCGKRDGWTQTECNQQWSCDDAHTYGLFSDARHSCDHYPGRLTLCGFYYPERHRGAWKTCRRCRDGLQPRLRLIGVRTTTPSIGWKIRSRLNPPGVVSVTSAFGLEKTATGGGPARMSVGAVVRRSDRSGEANPAGAGDLSISLGLRG